jgi:phytoene synthase
MFLSMAMTMHKVALIVAYLACASYGRRVQLLKDVTSGDMLNNTEARLRWSKEQSSDRSALAASLLSVHPTRRLEKSVKSKPRSFGRGAPSMISVLGESTPRTTFMQNDQQTSGEERIRLHARVAHAADVSLDPEQAQLREKVLEDAYAKCKDITEAASKSFAFATAFLTEDQARAIWAVYTWCRRTDDIVDSPRAMMSPETMRRDLNGWQKRLHETWDGEVTDTLDLALLDTKTKYPTLEIEPFLDMIKGMVMDTDYGQKRYETWDDMYLYCYRVASTVGLMTLPVFGTAPGYTEEEAKKPAIALGIALQITNILRDVGEDARRGRIYLPQEDMRRFRVTDKQIMAGIVDDNYRNLMKFEIERARDWYKMSHEGIPMLNKASRLGVRAAGDIYAGILEKLEENGYDNFKKRAYVPKPEKLTRLLGSWMTVSQIP